MSEQCKNTYDNRYLSKQLDDLQDQLRLLHAQVEHLGEMLVDFREPPVLVRGISVEKKQDSLTENDLLERCYVCGSSNVVLFKAYNDRYADRWSCTTCGNWLSKLKGKYNENTK